MMRRLASVMVILAVVGLATVAVAEPGTDTGVDGGVGSDGPGPLPADPVDVVSDPAFGMGALAGAAVAGLGAWLAFRGGAKFVTRENVLENETRNGIFELLNDKPGLHLRAIADELDLSTTNVLWHLRKLEDADLVRGKKLEGYKVFYPVEGGQDSKREAMASAVLRNDNAQAVLEYVATEPGAHQRQIARALDVNHGTVRWHLRKMLKTDLLMEIKRENSNQYYLTDLGASVIGQPEAEAVPDEAEPGAAPA
jgi:DNA-binding MarR family transcriptional regulator